MVEALENETTLLEQDAAGLRQLDAARLAAEELHVELPLDRLDLLAQGWLLHAEPLGGAGDVPLLRDRDEVPELPQVHHHIRSVWVPPRTHYCPNTSGALTGFSARPRTTARSAETEHALPASRVPAAGVERRPRPDPAVAGASGAVPGTGGPHPRGFPAGGPLDIAAWTVAPFLSGRFGQPFLVENRPGASGNTATADVVRAAPDGHTLLLCGPVHTINTTLFANLGFDFSRDIAPVALIARVPLVVEVNPSVPARSVPELVAYARDEPAGSGSRTRAPGRPSTSRSSCSSSWPGSR